MVGGERTGGRKENRSTVARFISRGRRRIFKAGINSGELLIRQIESGTQKPLSLLLSSFSPSREKCSLDEISERGGAFDRKKDFRK